MSTTKHIKKVKNMEKSSNDKIIKGSHTPNTSYIEQSSPTREGVESYNPWNRINKIIPEDNIHKILRNYGILDIPRNPKLFQIACVHKSYSKRDPTKMKLLEPVPKPDDILDLQEEDNERLEFIGDSILGCSIALYLYERYPEQSEGFYTRLRTKLVNNKTLGILVQAMGLNRWLIISKHVEEKCNGRKNLKILGGMLEAWIGAVFKEYEGRGMNGIEAARSFVIRILEKHIDFASIIHEDYNFKDQILKEFQARFGKPPTYTIVSIRGPPHDRTFEMGVVSPDDGSILATGTARAKKVAEQIASKRALEILEH
jgi:ribonuclease-3